MCFFSEAESSLGLRLASNLPTVGFTRNVPGKTRSPIPTLPPYQKKRQGQSRHPARQSGHCVARVMCSAAHRLSRSARLCVGQRNVIATRWLYCTSRTAAPFCSAQCRRRCSRGKSNASWQVHCGRSPPVLLPPTPFPRQPRHEPGCRRQFHTTEITDHHHQHITHALVLDHIAMVCRRCRRVRHRHSWPPRRRRVAQQIGVAMVTGIRIKGSGLVDDCHGPFGLLTGRSQYKAALLISAPVTGPAGRDNL